MPRKKVSKRLDPKKILERFKDPKVRARFDKAMAKLSKKTKPLIDAIRSSEDIGPDDLKIIVRENRSRFEEALAEMERELEPEFEANRRAERNVNRKLIVNM
jgi:hypothetical protein